MSRSPEDMSLTARLLMGGLFAVMGLVPIAVSLGVVEVDPDSVHAPMWIIGMLGGMFTLVGLWIGTAGTPVGRVLGRLTGPVVLIGLLSMLHWVAFGPGVRQCSGSISIPFVSASRPAGDLECRLAFGYGALLFDGLIFGAMLSTWAEANLEGTKLKVLKGTGNALIIIPLAPFFLVLVTVALIKAGWTKLRGTRQE